MTNSLPPHRQHPLRVLMQTMPFVCGCLLLIAASTAVPQLQEPGEQSEKLATTRNTMDQWVETRRLISTTANEWEEGRQLLEDRIAMLDRDILAITERADEADEKISETKLQLDTLRQQRDDLKEASESLFALIEGFEARTLALLKRLPEPLAQRLKPLSQGIPEPGTGEELGLARRFQNIIGILDAVNKFHREVSSSSEIRELADGTSAEVTVLYLGISLAYYASADGTIGGYGIPGEEGWVWQEANAEAPSIAQAVAIYANEQPAAFIPLPAKLD